MRSRRFGAIEERRAGACASRRREAGIDWHPLRYHKSPTAPATAYDIAAGTMLAIALAKRHRLNIVHARSYVAALIALAVKRVTGAKFLFDMRGLWADERVDGGLWPANGRLYRIDQDAGTPLPPDCGPCRDSDPCIGSSNPPISLSCADRAPPISVIPTCADLDRFTIQGPPAANPFVLGYVGSVGTWYLLDEMLRCFRLLQGQEPNARLLIVNRGEQAMIGERARAARRSIRRASKSSLPIIAICRTRSAA